MILILILTLFSKIILISINISDYPVFHNFAKNNSFNVNVTIINEENKENEDVENVENEENNEKDENEIYNVFIYNNINLTLPCNDTNENNNKYICNINNSGVYSIFIQNNETSRIIKFKNVIIIYNNNSEFKIEPQISINKCFDLENNITNKKLIKIYFNQIINSSLINFTLYNDTEEIKLKPYEINKYFTMIGVENQKFNAKNYNLLIEYKSGNLTYGNILDLTDTKTNSTPIPIFESFYELKKNKSLTSIKINSESEFRIKFTYFNFKDSYDNFDSPPEIIYPPADTNCDSSSDEDEYNLAKYNNTLIFKVKTFNLPGQAILRYNYCGKEYKNITDLIFEFPSDEDQAGLTINIISIKKILYFILIMLVI